jgi:predicted nucleic acid-binding protein
MGLLMEDIGPIYLDTNVFITAFEARTEVSKQLLKLFSAASIPQGRRFLTSEMTLAELLVLPLRNEDSARVTLYSTMIGANNWLDVQPVAREVLVRSAGLRAAVPSRKLPDAIHLATAILSGCTHLLSQDSGIGPKSGEQLALTVLRPDEPTLTELIERLSA